ncbi:Lipase (class 3) [Nakaseomyces glabratus]
MKTVLLWHILTLAQRLWFGTWIIVEASSLNNYNSPIEVATKTAALENEAEQIHIGEEVYERFVYFSKACGLCNCIDKKLLRENKTLDDEGCPSYLNFCSDPSQNPTYNQTRIVLVLEAEENELGTGYLAVDHEKKVIILAFRASTTAQDWQSDFETYPKEYHPVSSNEYWDLVRHGVIKECTNCKVHKGFSRFLETLGKHFLAKVQKIITNYPDYHIVSVGHSLGAALAALAGIELKLRGYRVSVITYAQPKIFNKDLKEWVDDLFNTRLLNAIAEYGSCLSSATGYIRVVHENDYVPMIPPFFHHAGLEVVISTRELPHNIQHLTYIGYNNLVTTEKAERLGMNSNLEELLHMYEHRNYFITLTGCTGF